MPSHPLLLFPDNYTVAAHDLYQQEHSAAINTKSTEQCEEHGQDSHKHAGHYQQILHEKWDSLSDQERAGWVEKTEKLQVENGDSWDDSEIYQCVKSHFIICDILTCKTEITNSSQK
jgi:hypothetical protein